MGSRSTSDGEIVDARIEKATTALPSAKGTSVNRRLREQLSPSPERSRTPSDTSRATSRDRSRSPYRASRYSRGEKRRRDDDDYGNRHGYDTHGPGRRYDDRRGRYDDDYGRDGHDGHLNYDDRRDRDHYESKRPRTRSRSPSYRDRPKHFVQESRLRGGQVNDKHDYERQPLRTDATSRQANLKSAGFETANNEAQPSKRADRTNNVNGTSKSARYNTNILVSHTTPADTVLGSPMSTRMVVLYLPSKSQRRSLPL